MSYRNMSEIVQRAKCWARYEVQIVRGIIAHPRFSSMSSFPGAAVQCNIKVSVKRRNLSIATYF